jgi:hypothetical protein
MIPISWIKRLTALSFHMAFSSFLSAILGCTENEFD